MAAQPLTFDSLSSLLRLRYRCLFSIAHLDSRLTSMGHAIRMAPGWVRHGLYISNSPGEAGGTRIGVAYIPQESTTTVYDFSDDSVAQAYANFLDP